MDSIEKNLMPNEQLLIETEMHWIIFFWPVVFTCCLVYFIFKQHIMFVLNYIAIVLIIYFLAGAFIRYVVTTYALSTQRVMRKEGMIFIRSWDMSLQRIESVQLQQSIFGKMIGYGDVVVNGTGGDRLVLNCIESPVLFQQKIFQAMGKDNGDS